MYDLVTGKVIGRGRKVGRLFFLDFCASPSHVSLAILPSREGGLIPNYVIKGVLAICPRSYKAALTSSPSLPASINRISACENGKVLYFIKADGRALPSKGEIVVLMGIQSD